MVKILFLSFVILFCFNLGYLTIAAQECGKRKIVASGRMFGAAIANRTEWPWNVALIHRQAEKFFCGGSLISAKHVLSAAHCFQNKNVREILSPNLLEAQLGRFNLNIKHETGSETLSVTKIVIHPDWNYTQFSYDADLSIVVLERKVTFTDFIQPICLPKQSDDVVSGNGTVVGWGKSETSGGTHANVPSKLELPVISADVCYTTFHRLAENSSTRMFCGGSANLEIAPCLGDSGGGFYFFNQNEEFYAIRGIVSGSLKSIEHGCDINKFSLFTHVAKFTDWIEKVMIEKMTIDWKFAEFNCQKFGNRSTVCSTTFEGQMTRNSKFRANFSAHKSKTNPIDVTDLNINFSPSMHVLSGIGEEFPNLRTLIVGGPSVEFIARLNFANLSQLEDLTISGTSVNSLPEDLLLDLPNLKNLAIIWCPQIQRLSEKLFMNQRKLKTLELTWNGLTILQKDSFKNNLELELLILNENKLKEIYVDFTRLPVVKLIDLQNNECIFQFWEPEDGPIQSLQDKIIRNCQPPRDV